MQGRHWHPMHQAVPARQIVDGRLTAPRRIHHCMERASNHAKTPHLSGSTMPSTRITKLSGRSPIPSRARWILACTLAGIRSFCAVKLNRTKRSQPPWTKGHMNWEYKTTMRVSPGEIFCQISPLHPFVPLRRSPRGPPSKRTPSKIGREKKGGHARAVPRLSYVDFDASGRTGNTFSLTSRPTRSPPSSQRYEPPILWCARRPPAYHEAGGEHARRDLASLCLEIRGKQDKAARGPPRIPTPIRPCKSATSRPRLLKRSGRPTDSLQ